MIQEKRRSVRKSFLVFFLGGYIDSSNPYENGAVPYFEEEVLETVTEGENVPSSLLSAPSD